MEVGGRRLTARNQNDPVRPEWDAAEELLPLGQCCEAHFKLHTFQHVKKTWAVLRCY